MIVHPAIPAGTCQGHAAVIVSGRLAKPNGRRGAGQGDLFAWAQRVAAAAPSTALPAPAAMAPRAFDGSPAAVTEAHRIAALVAEGALFVLGDSGGKDSQAMRIRVRALVPAAQLIVVHATLGDIEWPGALEHARDGAARDGLAFLVAQAPKTFLSMVEHRHRTRPDAPAFPQAGNRQCTSDLKRDPILTTVRRYAKAHGFTTIVTCMGLRSGESAKRAKAPTWARSIRGSVAGRSWFEWLPIHHLTTAEVFATIAEAGEQPHYAYGLGNDRLSCVFCIMGSARDARNGAVHHPDLFAQFVEVEGRTGSTLHQSRKPLEVFAGITVAEAREAHRRLPVLR